MHLSLALNMQLPLAPLEKSSANIPSSCAFIRKIFYYEFFGNFEKLKCTVQFVCLCWGFMAQSTQWGHGERGQFT